ncbi:restriction endonuclease subunit S [Prevotella veroralis]
MEEWKEYRYTDLATIIGGGTPKTSVPEYWSGEIPWLSVKDFVSVTKYVYDTEKYISELGLLNSSTKLLEKNDIVISARGTVGAMAMIPYPMCFNQSCFGLRGNNIVDKNFLYYLTRTKVDELRKTAHGSVFDTITRETFDNLRCLVPPLQTQQKIGNILSSLDSKIELNKRINDNLEQQAQALFKSWFVNFEPFKNGQFVDSELGKIPKGWKVGYLSEIADIIMGQSPNGSTYNENGEGIIFYQGRAEFGTRFPSIRLFTTNPTRIAPANSILISVRAPVGDINITHKECCIGRGLASAVSRTNKSAFLLYTLFSLKSDLDRFNTEGTVFGSINRKALETLKILIPTNDIISKFEAIVASMDQQILILHIESENLKILRDTLLPKLMSGERSVIHKENNDD